jgi:hypothetical protein
MTLKIDYHKLILYITVVVLLILLLKGCHSKNESINERDNLIEALNDTIVTWKDKDGLSHSKIQVLETSNTEMFLAIQSQDTIIQELQIEVEKYKKRIKNQGSVTVFNTITEYDTTFKYRNFPDSCQFTDNINNDFIKASYGINKDNQSFFSLKTYDKYTVVIGEEKEGLFKKKPYVEVVNHNPYSQTKTLRTYQTLQKKKNFSVGPHIGVGLTTDLSIRPYIGIGLQYTILRF